jgi:hypothetical protein
MNATPNPDKLPSKSDDLDALRRYREILVVMERKMDITDRRTYTTMSINKLESELRQIIDGIRNLPERPARNYFVSLDAVLSNLRRAQIELYVASDLLESKGKSTERDSRSFYKCLSNFQEFLYEALQNFR